MRIALLRLFGIALLAWAGLCDYACVAQAPPTMEAELSRYEIPVTRASLQLALKDKRPEVRSLAAGELAALKDTASAPLITDALEQEKDPQVKINLAAALLLLHSSHGTRTLLQICENAPSPEYLRLNAASKLVDAGDLGCLSSVLDMLQTTTDPSIKASALLTMARVKTMPASILPTLHAVLLASLQDRTSAVRQYAAECIASVSDKAALPYLQTAITNESDESAREHMEESSKILQGSAE